MNSSRARRVVLPLLGTIVVLLFAAGPAAGSPADADSTQVLLVHGEALTGAGMSPIVYGVDLRITNVRTGVSMTAMIGSAGPGLYDATFFDASNAAAAAGDVINIAFEDPAVAFLDLDHVLQPEEVLAGLVRIDIWVAGVSATGDLPGVPGDVRVTPNPFNPRAWVTFELSSPTRVQVDVLDPRGRRVRTLASGVMTGIQRWSWEGRDRFGSDMPSGVYLFRVTTPERTVLTKGLLLR